MGISTAEAAKIHQLAQDAGIADETVEQWTEELGDYRYAITSHTGSLKARNALEIRQRVKQHVTAQEEAATAPNAAGAALPSEPLATPRQVEYIINLLARRDREGIGSGFMDGPTDRAGIEKLTRKKASLYITSLKGEY
jgi:hypothetical protein